GAPRKGLRRLEPERSSQDHRLRLLVEGQGPPDGLHAARLARGGGRRARWFGEGPRLRDGPGARPREEAPRSLREGPRAEAAVAHGEGGSARRGQSMKRKLTEYRK